MSYLRRLSIPATPKALVKFFLLIETPIVIISFWELFDWFNHTIIDPTFTDPVYIPYLFWLIQGIVVMSVLGLKLRAKHFG